MVLAQGGHVQRQAHRRELEVFYGEAEQGALAVRDVPSALAQAFEALKPSVGGRACAQG